MTMNRPTQKKIKLYVNPISSDYFLYSVGFHSLRWIHNRVRMPMRMRSEMNSEAGDGLHSEATNAHFARAYRGPCANMWKTQILFSSYFIQFLSLLLIPLPHTHRIHSIMRKNNLIHLKWHGILMTLVRWVYSIYSQRLRTPLIYASVASLVCLVALQQRLRSRSMLSH